MTSKVHHSISAAAEDAEEFPQVQHGWVGNLNILRVCNLRLQNSMECSATIFRFGNGYTVMLHISGHPTDEHNSRITEFMTKTFPSAQLKEQHQNMLQYQLGSSLMSLAYIFGELEMARDWLHIEHYSVCQTTLDQVSWQFLVINSNSPF